MAQKIHPKSFRLGINENWSSKWLPEKMKKFSLILPEDILIEIMLKRNSKMPEFLLWRLRGLQKKISW